MLTNRLPSIVPIKFFFMFLFVVLVLYHVTYVLTISRSAAIEKSTSIEYSFTQLLKNDSSNAANVYSENITTSDVDAIRIVKINTAVDSCLKLYGNVSGKISALNHK